VDHFNFVALLYKYDKKMLSSAQFKAVTKVQPPREWGKKLVFTPAHQPMITPKYVSPMITQPITMGDNFSPRPIPPRINQRKLSSMITPVKPLDDNFPPCDHQKSFFLKIFTPRWSKGG
jgi:hypothetical protein